MNLKSYISAHFGKNTEFARMMGVDPQTVTKWLKIKYCVFDGYLWKRMRPIKQPIVTDASERVQAVILELGILFDGEELSLERLERASFQIHEIMNGVESEQRVESEEQGQEESSGD